MDLISRQAALDIALKYCPDDDGTCSEAGSDMRNMLDEIEALPPAEPKRMRATWISMVELQEGQITWLDYKCSNCSHHRGKPMNYCEVCGAKMEM